MYLVLFDVDGTLVDSQNIIFEGMRRAFTAVGRPAPAKADVLAIIGRSLPEAMATLCRDATAADVTELVEQYRKAFHELRAIAATYEALYPGARKALDQLARRPDVLLGIATGKSRRGVQAVVEAHGLHGRFVTVQTADTHPSKPHPSMVMTALTETGIRPERAIVVGDSSYDMLMARAAGVLALGVSWGYQPAEALAVAGAHSIVDTFEDVEPAIASLLHWAR